MPHIRTAQILTMRNGFGSTQSREFPKGTTLNTIIDTAKAWHENSVENSSDHMERDVYKDPRLYSVASGRELRQVPMRNLPVPARCSMHRLSPRQKQAWLLRERPVDEIAQEMSCSPLTVQKHLAVAKERVAGMARNHTLN